MAFVPDNDANYQAFLKARAKYSGPNALEFTKLFVQYFSNLCTVTGTSNAAAVTSAIASAQANLAGAKSVAISDANYLAALAILGSLSGNDFNECLEHIVKGHMQLATAVTSVNSTNAASVNSNAKVATKAAKHTY